MSKKAAVKQSSKKVECHAVHEFDLKGNHRIVLFKDGVPTVGKWTPFNAIANIGNILAVTDHFLGELPCGLFQVKLVAYERIEA